MNKEKFKWTALLFIALLSFVLAIATGNMAFNFVAIGLGVIIYKNGDNILFEKYNERVAEKKEQAKIFKEASKKIITERRLKNKGGDRKCQMEE
ncbi:MAG: hypothetical protein RSC33_03170 [Vagococcus sp.]